MIAMKTKVILLLMLLAMPISIYAQHKSLSSLMKSYSENEEVSYTEAGKSVIWMMKAAAPKGSMEGVKKLTMLQFKEGRESSSYISFREACDRYFAETGMMCVSREDAKKGGTMEVYMRREESPKEFAMLMDMDGNLMFMLMEGSFPSSMDAEAVE